MHLRYLQSVVDTNFPHLSLPNQNQLLDVIKKYDYLFDDALGNWNTEAVSFELKKGVKPYHGRAHPDPQAHKETLAKELNRLCKLVVLEWHPASERASPSFIVPKRPNRVLSQ